MVSTGRQTILQKKSRLIMRKGSKHSLKTRKLMKKSNKDSILKAGKIRIANLKRIHPPREDYKNYIKSRNLKRDFGITLDYYNILFEKQKGLCLICNCPQSSDNRSLCVDHNHETGEVRGLLCDKCNRGLGLFCEDINILNKAIKYLQNG